MNKRFMIRLGSAVLLVTSCVLASGVQAEAVDAASNAAAERVAIGTCATVSYTHLDVYKRQLMLHPQKTRLIALHRPGSNASARTKMSMEHVIVYARTESL